MSRRKQDKPQHLAKATAFEDPASEMSSLGVCKSERSTMSEAFDARETSPLFGVSDAEISCSEVPLDHQIPKSDVKSENSEPSDLGYTSLCGNITGSPRVDDVNLKSQTDLNIGQCNFESPLKKEDPNLDKQTGSEIPHPRKSVFKIEHDSEDNVGLHLVDSSCTDSCGGDQLKVDESCTSAHVSRLTDTESYAIEPERHAIEPESHVTKLQSFVDSLAKLAEPSRVDRSQPPCLPQYPKIAPTKATGCIGSFSGSIVRSEFPHFGYQSPANEASLTTISLALFSPSEQPLDLSTKKHAGLVSGETDGDLSSDIAVPEVRRRCLERYQMLQAELLRQRPSYYAGDRRESSQMVLSELDHSLKSSSFSPGSLTTGLSQGKHRSSHGEKYKRERTVSTRGEFSASEAAQMYKKSENCNLKETKSVLLNRSSDDTQRSVVTGKRKYSTLDEGSAREEHSPGSGAIPKCQRQLPRSSGNSSNEPGEAWTPRKENTEYTNMKCSCGTRFESLYQLAVHIERSGHMPGSLIPESLADLPKLVRGQDVWMSQGPEQAELILRCVQCRTSFHSLPELTVHMIRTKHYVNIVGTDGSAGQLDYGEPPREKESSPSGNLKDCRKKNEAYLPAIRDVSDRSLEMVTPGFHGNNSLPLNDEATDASPGNSQIQTVASGQDQVNLRSTLKGRGVSEGVPDPCEGNASIKKQSNAAYEPEREPAETTVVALDERKEGSRTKIGGDHSLRSNSLTSKMKISVTSNIKEQFRSSPSINSARTKGGPSLHTESTGNSRKTACVLKDARGIPKKVSDLAFASSCLEKRSSTGIPRIQSAGCKHSVKSLHPTRGLSGAKLNDGERINKRTRNTDYETGNDSHDKKVKSKAGLGKPEHQLSKDLNAARCLIREETLEKFLSTPDLRKERLLQNVSRWIASTEIETKRDRSDTEIEDPDPAGTRLELVSPPPEPVETSSILVAIKNFVDSSFSGQVFVSDTHSSKRNRFSSLWCPERNLVTSGGNFSDMNYAVSRTPGAGDNRLSPSQGSSIKRIANLEVQKAVQAPDPTERKLVGPTNEEQVGRYSDVCDPSCKQPISVALCDVSEVNIQHEEHAPANTINRNPIALPVHKPKSEIPDLINPKCLEESESKVKHNSPGSAADDSRKGVTAVEAGPVPESELKEDSSNPVVFEECSTASQRAKTTSTKLDSLTVDSTKDSQTSTTSSPVGIVSTTPALPDDSLRDLSSEREAISKPINFFLPTRSFEKVC